MKAPRLQLSSLSGKNDKWIKERTLHFLFIILIFVSCQNEKSNIESLSKSEYSDFNIYIDSFMLVGNLTYCNDTIIGYDFLNNFFLRVNEQSQSIDTLFYFPDSLLPDPKVVPNRDIKNLANIPPIPVIEPDQIAIVSTNEMLVCIRNKIFRFNGKGDFTVLDFDDYLGDSLILYPKKFPLLVREEQFYCGFIKKNDISFNWNKSDSILDRPLFVIIDTTKKQQLEFGGFMNKTYKSRINRFIDTWCSATFYGDTLVYSFAQDSKCYFIPPDRSSYRVSIKSFCFSDDDLAKKYEDGDMKRSNQYDIYKTYSYDKIVYDSYRKRIIRIATLPVIGEIINPYTIKKPWTMIFYYPDNKRVLERKFDQDKYAYGDIIPTPKGIIITNIYSDSQLSDFFTLLKIN
ncbi:MAG: hypothetical protein V2A67_07260 [Bacteroidota bacterium]